MRQVLARAATGLVAVVLVVGLLNPGTVSSRAIAPDPLPDITVTFRGLMVFDQLRNGVQVVRLHHDAEHHKINIRVVGPDFPDGVDWGRDLLKGVALQFEVLASPALPPNASWGSSVLRPFDIKPLHPSSVSLGDFVKRADGFGPIFTFKAGTFKLGEPQVRMDFVSVLDPIGRRDQPVPTFVEATISSLGSGQIGYLTGDGLDPFPLTKPSETPIKWKITVSNEPDYNHVCGYHFREYYKGFEYSAAGPVDYAAQYVAKLTRLTMGPCDVPHPPPLALDEVVRGKQRVTAIETRPCIPISY